MRRIGPGRRCVEVILGVQELYQSRVHIVVVREICPRIGPCGICVEVIGPCGICVEVILGVRELYRSRVHSDVAREIRERIGLGRRCVESMAEYDHRESIVSKCDTQTLELV